VIGAAVLLAGNNLSRKLIVLVSQLVVRLGLVMQLAVCYKLLKSSLESLSSTSWVKSAARELLLAIRYWRIRI
jgi:hypothetical protein